MYWKETRQSFKQLQYKEKEQKLEEKAHAAGEEEKEGGCGLWSKHSKSFNSVHNCAYILLQIEGSSSHQQCHPIKWALISLQS